MDQFAKGKDLLSSEELISILNSMDACLYASDLQSDEILFMNDKMKERFDLGYDPVGSVCWRVLHPEFDKRCEHCPADRLPDSPDTPVVREEYDIEEGRYYRNVDRVIRCSDAKILRLHQSEDITDIKENLIKAQDAAERGVRAKSEFLSRMSHEMRTPMNVIIGMTEIARNSDDPKRIEHCLDRIDNASKQLLGLINDILDMSQIEINELDITLVEFDFERMLMNITRVLNVRVEEKNQILIINIDEDVPPAFIGDEMRLSQVIMNLLTNAVKFTQDKGRITLNVHNTGISDGVCTLLVEVIDNGIGVSKEHQARLFDPFEQGDGSTDRKYGGTGLGLTISKGIVELFGGYIRVESELGQGSNFSFTVKMKVGKGIPRAELAHTIDKDDIRVLVVERAPEVRDYVTRIMRGNSLFCDTAESGSAALDMLDKNEPYNIYFLDWALPEAGCVDLTKKIRSKNPEAICIIMISQSDWSNMVSDESTAGVGRFIMKPLFPSMLINAINESFLGVTPETREAQDKTQRYDFSGHTLLIAEDIDINREIILVVLEDTNITIDFALNGAQALSMFEADPEKYSLILMDIQMPEMDGYEATKRIRALDTAKAESIPIIAMTANVFREDVEKCMQAGMNGHIGKPLDTEDLLSKLNDYFNKV